MSWVNLITSLATVVVTLAAVYAAARWKEKADDRAWLRQQRIEAYRDLLVDIDRVIESASDAAAIPTDNSEALAERLAQLITYAHSLDRAATRVGLVGPPELAKLAHQMVKVAFEDVWPASIQAQQGKLSQANWEEATEHLMQQYQQFRALARVDLRTDRQEQDIPTARAAASKARLLAELEKAGGSKHLPNVGDTSPAPRDSNSQPSDP